MIFSAQEIKNELILGLDGGARIPAPLLTTRIDKAMIRIFDTTAIMKLPRYFDETSGESFYRIAASDSGVSSFQHPHASTDLKTIRPLYLNRVTHEAGTTTPTVKTVDERTRVPLSQYHFVHAPGGSAGQEVVLRLRSKATKTVTFGFELVCAVSSCNATFVDGIFDQDFRDTLLSYLKMEFMMDTGKPYSNPNQALLHKREYNEGLNRLRFKADTGYTEGTRTVSPSYGFII